MIELNNTEFENLTSFTKINFGIDLSLKKNFVELRIDKLMQGKNFKTFSEYFEFICNDITGVAISEFVSNMTVNYTLFYREAYHFDFMKNEVLPYLFKKEAEKKDLRIWSAGCSTGEESYTLAIIVADFLGNQRLLWDMQILATDISETVLKKASIGAYHTASVERLPENLVKKYFMADTHDIETIHIAPEIRKQVIYRKHNLVGNNYNFKNKFHVIFCRNVMIYFDESTRYSLIKRFYDNLEDGGYLFIGMSETIDKHISDFKYIMPSVYRKDLK